MRKNGAFANARDKALGRLKKTEPPKRQLASSIFSGTTCLRACISISLATQANDTALYAQFYAPAPDANSIGGPTFDSYSESRSCFFPRNRIGEYPSPKFRIDN